MKLLNENFSYLKKILQQDDIKHAIDTFDFEYVYRILCKNNGSAVSAFTKKLLDLGINPLEYMTYVPEYFLNGSDITTFKIPDHIKEIGENAFWDCDCLTNIHIPNSIKKIGYSAFYNCASLTSITIPDSVTSIGDAAFQGCSELVHIVIPDSVTSVGSSVFHGCTTLKSITIGSNVTHIGDYTFQDCNNLEKIIIPKNFSNKRKWQQGLNKQTIIEYY